MCINLITDIKDEKIIKEFDCEEDTMNEFLKDFALTYNKTGEGITHVLLDEEYNKLVGYYTLKCNALQSEATDNEKCVIPAVEISRFAIHKDYQHKGNGQLLLADAIANIKKISSLLGVKMVFLYSLPDAEKFYDDFGFNYLSPSYKKLECEDSVFPAMYILLN